MAYPMHKLGDGVPASPDLPEVERAVLDYWSQDATFEASVEQREAGTGGTNEREAPRRLEGGPPDEAVSSDITERARASLASTNAGLPAWRPSFKATGTRLVPRA